MLAATYSCLSFFRDASRQAREESRDDDVDGDGSDAPATSRRGLHILCRFCYEAYDMETRLPVRTPCCSRRLCGGCAALFARCPYGAAFGCPSTIAAANATSREEPALPPAAFPVDAELVERWRVARILGLLTGP